MWMIYLIMIAIVLSIFLGFIKAVGLKNVILFMGTLTIIFGIVFLISGDYLVGGIAISAAVLVITIYFTILSRVKKKNEKQRQINEAKKIEQIKSQKPRKFYEQCKKAGVENLETESQRQRAKLIAKQLGLDENDIESLLKQQEQAIQEEVAKKQATKLKKEQSAKYDKDASEQLKMATPYPYFGQAKRASIWQEKVNECNKIIYSLDRDIQNTQSFRDQVVNTEFESKVDWAVAGGIGSAIGGSGAGVMAALDAQAENQRIAQRNEQKAINALESAKNSIILEQHYNRKRNEQIKIRNEYQKKIDEINLKLVDEIHEKDPFEVLKLSKATITQTKAEIELSSQKEAVIFGDVEAVIDGTFWAHIYQEKNYIGSVRIILPIEGVDCNTVKISIDTSLGLDEKKPYYVEYETEKLWFIEK